MKDRYKIYVLSKKIYKEFEFPTDKNEVKLGTGIGCDFRLHRDLFFGPIELAFIEKDGSWTLFCSDNLYVTLGDSRKLMTVALKHGDLLSVRYQDSDNDVFTIEFLIDFDINERKYERAIDISNCQIIPAISV